jgi:hypothetical protein
MSTQPLQLSMTVRHANETSTSLENRRHQWVAIQGRLSKVPYCQFVPSDPREIK